MIKRTPRSWLNTLFLLGTLALALICVPWKLAVQGLRWSEAVVLLAMYTATGLAITIASWMTPSAIPTRSNGASGTPIGFG